MNSKNNNNVQRLKTSKVALPLLALLAFSPQPAMADVQWRAEQQLAHFGDFNGDGLTDLLLQAQQPNPEATADDHQLVDAVSIAGQLQYHQQQSRQLPALINGLSWSAAEAQVVIADFNHDGYSDMFILWPDAHSALSFVSDGQAIDFIHTDLLGSPQAESNQQGGLN